MLYKVKLMCKCNHNNCQFEDFLSSKPHKTSLYFNNEDNSDVFCIFHTPIERKTKFTVDEKEIFQKLLDDYMQHCFFQRKKINFENVIFLDYGFKNKNLEGLEIDLTNATFINNVRFDNLKCKKLILRDTKFLDGGAIKNREKDENLKIGELEFRPYSLHSDFVIDIGSYVNDEGLVELDKQGAITELRFENHKVGSGKIFFIGLNERVKKADFRNMLLDNVFFQNSDLRNCYFLNSKIDKTEFRNCYFDQNNNKKFNNEIEGEWSWGMLMIFPTILFAAKPLFSMLSSNNIFLFLFLIVCILYIVIALVSLNIWVEFISYYLRQLLPNINQKSINATLHPVKSFNVHYSIADEKKIYNELDQLLKVKDKKFFKKQRETIQISLDSLSSSYSQLKDNFREKDFQISGDFFYSQRYSEMLARHKKPITDWMVFNVHHFTNGFGESYLKPLLWFLLTIILFALPLKPNEDYISTSATPYFLVKNITKSDDNKTTILQFNQTNELNSSFFKSLDVNKTQQENNDTLLGYDGRYNFEKPQQYILALDEEKIGLGLMKSFSNMIYPFTPEQKRWFQNISQQAVFLSLLESILLWYFAIAFILALWHRIKR